MKKYVQNRNQLLSHGATRLRGLALEIVDAALDASDPYRLTRARVSLNGSDLRVGNLTYDLSGRGNVYVLGAGKATYPIARALEDVLGDRISDGLIVLKRGQGGSLKRIRVIEASHPIPDSSGLRGAREMLKLASGAREGDLVFACITGGSSALLPMPIRGVTLRDKQRVNRLLLSCGASILEINAVRKHLSRIKGGRLAMAIFPAELINLTVSDVAGDPLDCITDLTVPDTSTFEDAMRTLKKYALLEKMPRSVRAHIKRADPRHENPGDFGSRSCHSFVIANNNAACMAAADRAEVLGIRAMILSTMCDGESRELGRTFAAIAKEIRRSRRPLEAPCALIAGGETVVTLTKNFGRGGPNQEFVMSLALAMQGEDDFVAVGLDTDGTDGPTPVAGAITDGLTVASAPARGVNLQRALQEHTVLPAFTALNDAIITGPTGTNVNDLKFLILA